MSISANSNPLYNRSTVDSRRKLAASQQSIRVPARSSIPTAGELTKLVVTSQHADELASVTEDNKDLLCSRQLTMATESLAEPQLTVDKIDKRP